MSDGNKAKKECDYGDRCYRQNPKHFQEFEHQHLNNLLKILSNSTSGALPEGIKFKVSRETIKEQLNILKALNPNLEVNASALTSHTRNNFLIGSEIDAKNERNSSPISRKRQSTSESNSASKEKKQQLDEACAMSGAGGSSSTSKNPSDALSSQEFQKKVQSARSMDEAMTYFQDARKRSQGNILDKLKTAAPYNFFLTSVTDSKHTHKEQLSLQLFDVLDPALGDLESSLQINFMVEFGWLMAQYLVANQKGKPLTILYGEMDVRNLQYNGVTAVQVKCPSPFGSHHTKMCVMAYRDGSVRVCVHTSNLVESDWDNRTQGLWLSPLCPALPLGSDTAAGESPTGFKRDLLEYLSAYRIPELQPWMAKLRRADFSQINVFFVASVPGSHKGVDVERWGHSKLASLLKRHVQITPKSGSPPSMWQIIAQCSSIGSLGQQPTAWFCGEVKQAMSRGVGQSLQSSPPIRLVYPSFENVVSSYDGILGGGCLPYVRKTHEKQPWLEQYLYQWKCERRHRTRAVPHIKTYTRVSPDLCQAAWFHLTSANLSKAAWGSLTKAGALTILSYEAGVLFIPKFVLGTTSFPIKEGTDDPNPVFPMPYDLPLVQYTASDVPWFMDNLC